jgi:hypothetical protein
MIEYYLFNNHKQRPVSFYKSPMGQLSQTLVEFGHLLAKRVKPLNTLNPWNGLDTRGSLEPYTLILMHIYAFRLFVRPTYTY